MKYVPVTLLVPIPEELHTEVQEYLDTHPGWDQERLFTAALSLFLMQNGCRSRVVSQFYLNTLFDLAA